MKDRNHIALASLLLCCFFLWTKPASAGVYTDDLSKCLVAKSTPEEKTLLMTWLFAAIALNPKLAPMVNMTAKERDKINSDTGKLFEKMLTDTCKPEAKLAIKNDGTSAIVAGFNVFGEVGVRELYSEPLVAEEMDKLHKYLEMEKFKVLFEPK